MGGWVGGWIDGWMDGWMVALCNHGGAYYAMQQQKNTSIGVLGRESAITLEKPAIPGAKYRSSRNQRMHIDKT